MVTLGSGLIWQIINFILPPHEYGCVYASLSGAAIDLQKMSILAKKIVFSDEAHFDLGGYVNEQNCRIWGTENPNPKRVTVWFGFWSRGIIVFYENEQGEAVTVNGDHYRAMLNEFLFTKIEGEDIGNIWFQQDMSHSRSYTRYFVSWF